ncbi:unnamed protein product [Periconia digitata]|uniref:Uncharacterized protein n=1 Tax=Periconia digitata TaxID=1303443 RepID=A0A9W4U5L0_9PLEO|nr:unnamed protein product [Periconia digitata]
MLWAVPDCPGELIVQLPSLKGECESSDGHQNWQCNQLGTDLGPYIQIRIPMLYMTRPIT